MSDAFARKKSSILSQLAVSEDEYTDRSVKGSIDEPISDLINEINACDGLVTTSSCSGRISVFLEGAQIRRECKDESAKVLVVATQGLSERGDGQSDGESFREDRNEEKGEEEEGEEGEEEEEEATLHPSKTVGKKRKGGTWLYVNHAALDLEENAGSASTSSYLHDLFGMNVSRQGFDDASHLSPADTRFVHFKFEPMILHILTASTEHAHRVLAAAQASGFRESGATGLFKAKEPDHESVVVAVRTSGLLLDSIIGYSREKYDSASNDGHGPEINSMVNETYLQTLVRLANIRFVENAKRRDRFREALRQSSDKVIEGKSNEVKMKIKKKEAQRQIKIAKGRKIQEEKQKERWEMSNYKDENEDKDTDGLEWVFE